jgi:uncharacterized protein
VELRGLQFDRRWMLIDSENKFVTQRELPEMALFRLEIKPPFLEIFHKNRPDERLKVPLEPDWQSLETARVETWSWKGAARICPNVAADFFSENLKSPLRLAFMPDTTRRQADRRYAEKGQMVSFADGFPFLIIGQSSLDFLNEKLKERDQPPMPWNRFRTNFVFSGGNEPFSEDNWSDFSIGAANFRAVKPCARCVMTTIDQENLQKTAEPLKTLATFRFKNNRIYFGQNVVWLGGEATVRVGDLIDF